jgi:hypothetical protein
MSNVAIIGSNPSFVNGTMGTNGTLSEEFDLGMYTQIGLMADNLTNGTLNFLVADQLQANGGTYRLLRDNAGAAVAYGPLSGNVALKESDMRILAPYRYVRLLASIAQANGPTFKFVVKG